MLEKQKNHPSQGGLLFVRFRKYPEKAQRPSLAQPDAVLQSAMRGLTTEFGMGSGDPSLYGCAISRYSLVKLVHPDICIGT